MANLTPRQYYNRTITRYISLFGEDDICEECHKNFMVDCCNKCGNGICDKDTCCMIFPDKFKNKYYFAWSNGIVDEDSAGQRVLISSSDDAIGWSKPICIAGDKNDKVVSHSSIGLYATKEKLYLIGGKMDCHR